MESSENLKADVRLCTVKPVLSGHSKRRPKLFFKTAGQKEHSAILSTFIELPFVIKIFVLSMNKGHVL